MYLNLAKKETVWRTTHPCRKVRCLLLQRLGLSVLIGAAALLVPLSLSAEPLRSHNLHPLYAPFIQLQPMSALISSPRTTELSLLHSYGNNFFLDTEDGGNSEITADLDSEAAYTSIHAQYGLTERLELNLNLTAISHFPGIMDGFLQWYHGVFGFPNADRELRPDYRLSFYLENSKGVIIDEYTPLIALSALQIEARMQLYRGTNIDAAVGTAVKLPILLTRHPLNSGGFDGAVRFFAGYRLAPLEFEASIGSAYLSKPAFVRESEFSRIIFPFFFSTEWQLQPRVSALVTINGTSSPFKTGYRRADNFSAVANFGGSFIIDSQNSIQLSMSQEFLTFAATDVAVHFRWTHTVDRSAKSGR
ncbi:MAG: DUF3187 family protein [Spirochaetia bacterium]